ncbi:MAG TPA: hypothetical protein VGN74_11995 [Brevundimonas sp.]|jgi:hypothetical protein|uniref:hypothetical protein n=1 Tax=Brevundimonas sp. TaxID=1871086 RepID=UPI002E130384|nr:hypothetical protein [Brevundimonas sp.]
MFRFLIPATAILATLALAGRTEPQTVDGATPMQWTLTHEGDLAKLAYGVPNSDHLAVMLTCSPGEAVNAWGPVRPDSPALMRAAMAPAPIDPLSGELLLDLRLASDDPALISLARGDGLPVVNDDDVRARIPAGPEGRRLAAAFLGHCASART